MHTDTTVSRIINNNFYDAQFIGQKQEVKSNEWGEFHIFQDGRFQLTAVEENM